MAFSPPEYCRFFAQKKAYQGGVTGTPGPPLATPLIWSKLKEYNSQLHAVTSLQTDYPAEQVNSAKKGITCVSTFLARIILTALHVTHTPGTPGVVVLTKSVLREVAVSQLLHPRIWFLMCDWNILCFLLTQSLPDFGPESVKPDFNFKPLALAACDVFPFDNKRNRFVWIKVLPAMMTSINTVSCSSLNKHWDILSSRETGEIFLAIRFHKKLGVYWTHKYW